MPTRRDLIKAMGLAGAGLLPPTRGGVAAGGTGPTHGPNAAHDALEQYERRFAEARLRMPIRNPARAEDRMAIARQARHCLGIRDAWVPAVAAEVARQAAFEGGRIELLRGTSWPGVACSALLLIPQDLFHHMARKVRDVYRSANAEAALRASVFPGEHPWDTRRTAAMGDFLAQHLGLHRLAKAEDEREPLLSADDRCFTIWPAQALDTDHLAEQLTGRRVDANLRLWDVYPPQVAPEAIGADIVDRGSTRQILAQFQAFLKSP